MDVTTRLMLLKSDYRLWMLPLGRCYRCQAMRCGCYHHVDILDVRMMDVGVTTRFMS